VAENEPPVEPPTPPTGMPALPAVPAPPSMPPGLNADDYRRFQEFQRFQDYQRYVETQGGQPAQPQQPPTHQPPHHELMTHLSDMRQQLARIERITNPPLWQKILRNKWLHRAVWLVIVVVLATWGVPQVIHHYFGNADTGTGPGALPLPKGQSGVLPDGPHQAVADVYMFVAENQPTAACLIFSDAAKQQFAVASGAGDCPSAVTALYGQLIDKAAYAQPILTELPGPQGGSMTISSCSFKVTGGPRLGTFTLTKQAQGWEITAYQAPSPCPAPTSGSAPPT
jgi:hypothetical protein